MGADTKIEWAHHTFNPWRGCTHVSPGCENCYAETLAARFPANLGTWGAGGERVIASEAYWRQPLAWNRAAEKAGERRRVFCASLADVFEGGRRDLIEPRIRVFDLIERTPHLDWLILTKRPENAQVFFESYPEAVMPNVWLGVSVEDQRRADERIPILLETQAAVRFLSCEPLLGSVRISPEMLRTYESDNGIDWVIVGGESGPGARPMDLAWARSLVDQCADADVKCFVKQLGARPVWGETEPINLRDRKGGDMAEWPADLKVREFPAARDVERDRAAFDRQVSG